MKDADAPTDKHDNAVALMLEYASTELKHAQQEHGEHA